MNMLRLLRTASTNGVIAQHYPRCSSIASHTASTSMMMIQPSCRRQQRSSLHTHNRNMRVTANSSMTIATTSESTLSCSLPSAPLSSSSPSLSRSLSVPPRRTLPAPFLINILSLTLSQLVAHLHSLGHPPYRARQLMHWIYVRGVRDFSAMDNLSRAMQSQLATKFCVDYGHVVKTDLSIDGTRKYLVGYKQTKKSSELDAAVSTSTSTASLPSSSSIDASSSSSSSIAPLSHIECVYIPMGRRGDGAVCVSSQVGCTLSCSFCATGAMSKARMRNLTVAEIVGQVMIVKHAVGDFDTQEKEKGKNGLTARSPSSSFSSPPLASSQSTRHRHSVTNVVFMGMGEPGYNYRSVAAAIRVLTSCPSSDAGAASAPAIGLGFGRPRITVSTSGVVPAIDLLLEDFGGNVSLAISLHATNDRLRDELVPINKTYPIGMLMDAVRRYQNGRIATNANDDDDGDINDDDSTGIVHHRPPSFSSLSGRKRVTLEYVMLNSINDSLGDARSLVRLLDGIHSLVNLIPFNPWIGSNYTSSSPDQIQAFAEIVRKGGIECTIRGSRGRDINGACGQLAINNDTIGQY